MEPFPPIDPYDAGTLDVGDGHRIFWEISGNSAGKPAVVLHGGPGSGSSPGARRLFDPAVYRIVQFDQRNCGRSTPSAAEPSVDLSANTTRHLIGDCERIREHLGIDCWLVCAGSWGTTLGLAYAQAHPARVTELVLMSVVTTSRAEVEWATRAMGRVFPEEWARFRDALPEADRDGDFATAYSALLHDDDPQVREHAARAWCAWEDVHVATHPGHVPDPRYESAHFRLCFARLVTHYWSNAAFLGDGQLLKEAHRLAGIPGIVIQGRLDISAPADIAWQLAQAWPDAELVIVGDAGHGAGHPSTMDALLTATARLGQRR